MVNKKKHTSGKRGDKNIGCYKNYKKIISFIKKKFVKFTNEENIPKLNLISLVLIVALIGVSTFYLSISSYYLDFKLESRQIENSYKESQKNRIKEEVNTEIHDIDIKRKQAERKIKEEIKERAYEAYMVALNIYEKNRYEKTIEEIKKMILDVLRPIRFNKGRGYYFVLNKNGVIKANSSAPDLENKNVLEFKDSAGNYVFRDFIDLVNKKEEGYSRYLFNKPGNTDMLAKYSYVKFFEPFDWIIGTGEYLNDVEQEVQNEILEKLRSVKIENKSSDYLFVIEVLNKNGGDNFGKMIVNPNRLDLIGKYLSDSEKDPKGNEFYKKFLEVSRNNGEKFTKYWYKKPGDNSHKPKMAYIKYYPEWSWIVGKGFYFDDLEKMIKNKRSELKNKVTRKIIYLSILFITFTAITLFIAVFISRKLEKIFNNYKKKLEEQNKNLKQINKNLEKEALGRKKIRDVLVESEKRHRSFIENIPLGLYRSTPGIDGKILMANPAIMKIFGFKSIEEGRKMKVADFYVDPKQREAFSKELLEKGNVSGFELLLKKRDGSHIWGSVTNRLVLDKNGKVEYFDGSIEDITEKKKAQEKLKESYERLKEADRMKDDFISIASHELRTPMTIIRGYSSMILEDHEDEISEEVSKQVKNILKSSKRLIEMVNDMLDIAKIESGKLSELSSDEIDVVQIIEEIEASFSQIAREKNMKVSSKFDSKDLPKVLFNEAKLRQIFTNLVGNAIKYAGEGKKIEISAKKSKVKNKIEISVEDNGEGIPKEFYDKIFEKFGMVTSALNKNITGTGLGLAICKRIVEHYGGKIWVSRGERLKGANFSFTVPAKK